MLVGMKVVKFWYFGTVIFIASSFIFFLHMKPKYVELYLPYDMKLREQMRLFSSLLDRISDSSHM